MDIIRAWDSCDLNWTHRKLLLESFIDKYELFDDCGHRSVNNTLLDEDFKECLVLFMSRLFKFLMRSLNNEEDISLLVRVLTLLVTSSNGWKCLEDISSYDELITLKNVLEKHPETYREEIESVLFILENVTRYSSKISIQIVSKPVEIINTLVSILKISSIITMHDLVISLFINICNHQPREEEYDNKDNDIELKKVYDQELLELDEIIEEDEDFEEEMLHNTENTPKRLLLAILHHKKIRKLVGKSIIELLNSPRLDTKRSGLHLIMAVHMTDLRQRQGKGSIHLHDNEDSLKWINSVFPQLVRMLLSRCITVQIEVVEIVCVLMTHQELLGSLTKILCGTALLTTNSNGSKLYYNDAWEVRSLELSKRTLHYWCGSEVSHKAHRQLLIQAKHAKDNCGSASVTGTDTSLTNQGLFSCASYLQSDAEAKKSTSPVDDNVAITHDDIEKDELYPVIIDRKLDPIVVSCKICCRLLTMAVELQESVEFGKAHLDMQVSRLRETEELQAAADASKKYHEEVALSIANQMNRGGATKTNKNFPGSSNSNRNGSSQRNRRVSIKINNNRITDVDLDGVERDPSQMKAHADMDATGRSTTDSPQIVKQIISPSLQSSLKSPCDAAKEVPEETLMTASAISSLLRANKLHFVYLYRLLDFLQNYAQEKHAKLNPKGSTKSGNASHKPVERAKSMYIDDEIDSKNIEIDMNSYEIEYLLDSQVGCEKDPDLSDESSASDSDDPDITINTSTPNDSDNKMEKKNKNSDFLSNLKTKREVYENRKKCENLRILRDMKEKDSWVYVLIDTLQFWLDMDDGDVAWDIQCTAMQFNLPLIMGDDDQSVVNDISSSRVNILGTFRNLLKNCQQHFMETYSAGKNVLEWCKQQTTSDKGKGKRNNINFEEMCRYLFMQLNMSVRMDTPDLLVHGGLNRARKSAKGNNGIESVKRQLVISAQKDYSKYHAPVFSHKSCSVEWPYRAQEDTNGYTHHLGMTKMKQNTASGQIVKVEVDTKSNVFITDADHGARTRSNTCDNMNMNTICNTNTKPEPKSKSKSKPHDISSSKSGGASKQENTYGTSNNNDSEKSQMGSVAADSSKNIEDSPLEGYKHVLHLIMSGQAGSSAIASIRYASTKIKEDSKHASNVNETAKYNSGRNRRGTISSGQGQSPTRSRRLSTMQGKGNSYYFGDFLMNPARQAVAGTGTGVQAPAAPQISSTAPESPGPTSPPRIVRRRSTVNFSQIQNRGSSSPIGLNLQAPHSASAAIRSNALTTLSEESEDIGHPHDMSVSESSIATPKAPQSSPFATRRPAVVVAREIQSPRKMSIFSAVSANTALPQSPAVKGRDTQVALGGLATTLRRRTVVVKSKVLFHVDKSDFHRNLRDDYQYIASGKANLSNDALVNQYIARDNKQIDCDVGTEVEMSLRNVEERFGITATLESENAPEMEKIEEDENTIQSNSNSIMKTKKYNEYQSLKSKKIKGKEKKLEDIPTPLKNKVIRRARVRREINKFDRENEIEIGSEQADAEVVFAKNIRPHTENIYESKIPKVVNMHTTSMKTYLSADSPSNTFKTPQRPKSSCAPSYSRPSTGTAKRKAHTTTSVSKTNRNENVGGNDILNYLANMSLNYSDNEKGIDTPPETNPAYAPEPDAEGHMYELLCPHSPVSLDPEYSNTLSSFNSTLSNSDFYLNRNRHIVDQIMEEYEHDMND